MFNGSAFLTFLDTHKNLPHVSKYHREGYMEHCLLVIYEMAKRTDDSAMLIAACLHDLAKPRTQAYNKIGEPCFYDHEEVTDEELSQFLSPDDPRFGRVKALVLCHMAPYHVQSAKDYDSALVKRCCKCLKNGGIEMEVDDAFIHDVTLLHDADDAGTVRSDEQLTEISKPIAYAISIVKDLA